MSSLLRRLAPGWHRLQAQWNRLQHKVAPPEEWRWGLFVLLCFLTGLGLSLIVGLVEHQSIRLALAGLAQGKTWALALLLGTLVTLLGFLFHSLFAAAVPVTLATLALTFVNYYKVALTATPLQLADFALAGRVGQIASLNAEALALSPRSATALWAAVLLLGVLFFLSKPLRLDWKKSAMAAILPLALLLEGFWTGADNLVFQPLGAPISQETMGQSEANYQCGTILGLMRSLQVRSAIRAQEKQLAADQAQLAAMLDQDTAGTRDLVGGREGKQPNVILFLAESFFDVTTLPGVSLEEDPLLEFHALQAEGVSGDFMTRTIGYGTANIELEILTGINTFFTNKDYVFNLDPPLFSRLPSVPSLMRDNGYRTVFLHTYNDGIYGRTPILEALGFEEIYFSDGFAAIDPQAAAADYYWTYMSQYLSGTLYSDDYLADLLLLLDGQEDQRPFFAFALSMENHSPHYKEKFDDTGYTVQVTSPLSGDAADILTAACQGINNTSEALGKLTDYFREQEEPTVILFFGDHRPGLGLPDGLHTVYSELGMCEDAREWFWTMDQRKELYTTSYLIWSNDPDYLPAPAGTRQTSSSNYLGLSLLDAAGIQRPLFWRILDQMSQDRIIDTNEYRLGRDGVPTSASQDPALSLSTAGLLRRYAHYLTAALGDQEWVAEELGK